MSKRIAIHNCILNMQYCILYDVYLSTHIHIRVKERNSSVYRIAVFLEDFFFVLNLILSALIFIISIFELDFELSPINA